MVLVLTSSALGVVLWMPARSAAVQHQHSQPAQTPSQTAVGEPREQELKVGKKGDIQFNEETIVGDLRLKAGRYQIQHRVDGADHLMHFTELTKGLPSGVGGGSPKSHPGEVKCRLEPLDKKASRTTVFVVQEGGARRVTRILVAGENVTHAF